MSIILVRHGETALNVARVLQPADTPLSERGQVQAQAVARRLATMGLVGIVSSDLPRALATAEAIAAATGAPIETSALLQERNFGDFRGQSYEGLGLDPMTLDAAPPGGESMASFIARVALAFADVALRRERLGGPLAVVTHGLVIGVMLDRHVQAVAGGNTPAPGQVVNTSLSIVSAQPPHRLELRGCILHLESA